MFSADMLAQNNTATSSKMTSLIVDVTGFIQLVDARTALEETMCQTGTHRGLEFYTKEKCLGKGIGFCLNKLV